MTLDFARLATYVVEAREALDWRQKDLAEHASASRSAIQNLEKGRPFTRIPKTLAKVERAFGWEPGSCMTIARGGEPMPPAEQGGRPRREPVVDEGAATSSGMRALPTGVQAALDDGEVFATDVITLPITGGKFHLVLVVTKGAYSTPEEKEVLRQQMEEWIKIQEGIRDIADLKIDP